MFNAINRNTCRIAALSYMDFVDSDESKITEVREKSALILKKAINFTNTVDDGSTTNEEKLHVLLYQASIELKDKYTLEVGMQMLEASKISAKEFGKNAAYYSLLLNGSYFLMMGQSPDRRVVKKMLLSRSKKKDWELFQTLEGQICKLFSDHEDSLLFA